jgi:hypothetical protein
VPERVRDRIYLLDVRLNSTKPRTSPASIRAIQTQPIIAATGDPTPTEKWQLPSPKGVMALVALGQAYSVV